MRKNSAPRRLSADIVSLFEVSQSLAADVLAAANIAEATAYASAAQAMETAARRERSRIGYSALRLAARKG